MLEGLPPNAAAHLMRLACDETTARRVADIMVETFDPAETAAVAFEDSATARDFSWAVDIYFRREPVEADVRRLVESVAGKELAAQAVFTKVAETNWVAASLAGLDAVRIGRFVVHGAHERGRVRPNEIGIEIEAALAFGTGHHGTTRGCLAMLNDVARRRRPRRILDIGTGTGVLAIAAARLWRCHVAASDVDAVAVETARENASRNRTGVFVRPIQASGTNHPSLSRRAPYDLVFANILARPLAALAPSLRRRLASGGEIILSGLLADDVPSVISAYHAQGVALVKRRDTEGWATLLMRLPSARSEPRHCGA